MIPGPNPPLDRHQSTDPTKRIKIASLPFLRTLCVSVALCCYNQLLRLVAEAAEFFTFRTILVPPLDGFVVPAANFLFVVQLPVCHGENEPLVTIPAVEKLHPPLDALDCGLEITGLVLSRSKNLPTIRRLGSILEGSLGQLDGSPGVAELRSRTKGQ